MYMSYKIMLVEDDEAIAELVVAHLAKYGYEVISVREFDKILDVFVATCPHLVLLDINLPQYDGYYWCKKIRQVSTNPIILISARAGEMDQVLGLESGADDYITKPFSYDVVIAKVKSQLRRSFGEFATKERRLEYEGMILYPERPELHFYDQSIVLTKNEALLTELLLSRAPRAVRRETILEKIWDDQTFIDENTLNVNITRLRKKMQQLGIDNCLETVRGYGYRLRACWRRQQ